MWVCPQFQIMNVFAWVATSEFERSRRTQEWITIINDEYLETKMAINAAIQNVVILQTKIQEPTAIMKI